MANRNEKKEEANTKPYTGPIPAHMPRQRQVQDFDQPTSILDPTAETISDKDGMDQTALVHLEEEEKALDTATYVEEILREIREREQNQTHQQAASLSPTTFKPVEEQREINPDPPEPRPENEEGKSRISSVVEQYSKFVQGGFYEDDEDDYDDDQLPYWERRRMKREAKREERMALEESEEDGEYSEEYEEELTYWERRRLKKEAKQARWEEEEEEENHPVRRVKEDKPEQEDDFKSPIEAKEKAKVIAGLCTVGATRTVFLAVLFLAVLFVQVSNAFVPIESLSPQSNPRAYAIFNALLMGIGAVISFRTLLEGAKKLMLFRANGSSMLSVLTIAALVYSIYLIVKPEAFANNVVHSYSLLVLGGLLVNSAAKWMAATRTRRNFEIVSSSHPKKALELVEDEELENEMIRVMSDPDMVTAVPVKTGFLKRFLELSLEDEVESIDRYLAPICLLVAAAIAVGCQILFQDGHVAMAVFLSVLSVCAPFTSVVYNNLALSRASKRLTRLGAMISGAEAVYDFSQVSAVVIDASELFPKGSIRLQGIKTFEGGRIDESIIDATSLMCDIKGTLADMFMGIIEDRPEILNEVDTVVFEEEMGISAWVDGRRILIGNRDLMINHGIDVPSNDYESKYKIGGRELVYLATSGVLTTMYIVKYMGEVHIGEMLRRLTRNHVSVIVRTSDPNITSYKLADIFGLELEQVRVIPQRTAGPYERVTRPRPRVDAKIAYEGDVMGYLSAVYATTKINGAGSISIMLQTIGIVLGYAVIIFCAFFSKMSMITPLLLFGYNFFLLAVVWMICGLWRT